MWVLIKLVNTRICTQCIYICFLSVIVIGAKNPYRPDARTQRKECATKKTRCVLYIFVQSSADYTHTHTLNYIINIIYVIVRTQTKRATIVAYQSDTLTIGLGDEPFGETCALDCTRTLITWNFSKLTQTARINDSG